MNYWGAWERRSVKVESFWPLGEPSTLPCGCPLIQTCCLHPLPPPPHDTHTLSMSLRCPTLCSLITPFSGYMLQIQAWIDFLWWASSSLPSHDNEESLETPKGFSLKGQFAAKWCTAVSLSGGEPPVSLLLFPCKIVHLNIWINNNINK